MYSNGNGTICPALVISIIALREALMIAVCITGSFGAPALAPIGTNGATALGVPVCLTTGGSAAMITVGIPADSIALCTSTAERWQVPQPAVRRT